MTVPAGIGPGMPFMVNAPGGEQMQVVCPPNAQAGMQMLVNVPVATVPEPIMMGFALSEQTATPVPVVQAVAVQAPVPMTMGTTSAAATPGGTLTFLCNTDKGKAMVAALANGVPSALASRGMTQAEWSECAEALKDIYNAQFFKDCPVFEGCYYCCPGGPIQAFLCVCNPVTCIVCIQPVERKRDACVAKCSPILHKYGYMARKGKEWENGILFCPAQ